MSKLRPSSPSSHLQLVDMPETVLHHIFRLLAPAGLASLALQGRYLRAVAQDSYLWEAHCLARWPGAEAQLYGGDWCRLYCARSAQPAQLPQATDKVRALTAAAAQRAVEQQAQQQHQAAAASAASGGAQQTQRQRGEALAGLAFEEVMRCLFTVGLAVTREPALKRSPEFKALKRDLGWWLRESPQAVVGFVRSSNEQLGSGAGGFGAWAGGSGWGSATWRRSSIAFLQDLGLLSAAHQSVAERVHRETQALDRAMRGTGAAPSCEAAPEGVPSRHWWYHAPAQRVAA